MLLELQQLVLHFVYASIHQPWFHHVTNIENKSKITYLVSEVICGSSIYHRISDLILFYKLSKLFHRIFTKLSDNKKWSSYLHLFNFVIPFTLTKCVNCTVWAFGQSTLTYDLSKWNAIQLTCICITKIGGNSLKKALGVCHYFIICHVNPLCT